MLHRRGNRHRHRVVAAEENPPPEVAEDSSRAEIATIRTRANRKCNISNALSRTWERAFLLDQPVLCNPAAMPLIVEPSA